MESKLVDVIRKQTELIFYNMSICMKTYDRETLICGTPSWRYVYHTLHSCDKWFQNPTEFIEPEIQVEHLDQVDIPCSMVLRDEELWTYFNDVKGRVMHYLASITDEQLYEKPKGCEYTRMELILGQYRHFMCHIGILNGFTIAKKGKYPMVVGLDAWKNHKMDGKLFDE